METNSWSKIKVKVTGNENVKIAHIFVKSVSFTSNHDHSDHSTHIIEYISPVKMIHLCANM